MGVICIWFHVDIAARGSSRRCVGNPNILCKIQKVRRNSVQLRRRLVGVEFNYICRHMEIAYRGSILRGFWNISGKSKCRGVSGRSGFVDMSAVGR